MPEAAAMLVEVNDATLGAFEEWAPRISPERYDPANDDPLHATVSGSFREPFELVLKHPELFVGDAFRGLPEVAALTLSLDDEYQAIDDWYHAARSHLWAVDLALGRTARGWLGYEPLGEALSLVRQLSGLSQGAIAHRMQLSPAMISYIENHTRDRRVQVEQAMLWLLSCDRSVEWRWAPKEPPPWRGGPAVAPSVAVEDGEANALRLARRILALPERARETVEDVVAGQEARARKV